MISNEMLLEGARQLVDVCAGVRSFEKVYIISDESTLEVAERVHRVASERAAETIHDTIPSLVIHGSEPSGSVASHMKWANVIFCLSQMSMAHTSARKAATDFGSRFLSLPDYSLDLLGSKCLRFDFNSVLATSLALTKTLDEGKKIRVTTDMGTDFSFGIEGRKGNNCPGLCREPGALASPPDSEVNIAPVEGEGQGVIVVDGSIPCREIGLLEKPIRLRVENSKIIEIIAECPQSEMLKKIFERAASQNAYILGEFGIGLNPLASLSGIMLEDEGCAGTIHFGFGSNATIGGKNAVSFHLDFIVKAPNVTIDDTEVMRGGQLL